MREPASIKRAKTFRHTMTKAETLLWSRLQRQTCHVRRQYSIGPYFVDFACIRARLIIEVDGLSHEPSSAHRYDEARSRFLTERGWQVYRTTNTDVFQRLDDVADSILQLIQDRISYFNG